MVFPKRESKENKVGKSRRKSIKRKLTLSIMGITVAVTIVCGAALSALLYSGNVENMQERVLESAVSYKKAVSHAIETYQVKVEAMAQNPMITSSSLNTTLKKTYLAELAKQNGFLEVSITDPKGITLDDIDISSREYFIKAMAGETYISSPLVSQKDNATVLIMGTKIKNGNGSEGVLFALHDSNIFSQMIDDIAIGESGFGYIVDKYGVIVADKNRENVSNFVNYITLAEKEEAYEEMAAVTERMIAGEKGIMKAELNGKQYTIGYMPIENTDGWSIAVCAVEGEMMDSFNEGILITIGLVILVIVLSIVVSIRIARPIANPIVALVRRIELLAEGDLHTEVPKVTTQDELGVLSEAFTDTVETLNGYIAEISQVLGSMAKGDITVEAKKDYRGDFKPIRTALDTIIENLNLIFGRMVESSMQVSAGAEQVSATSQSMAQGATEQAAAVEEFSATLNEIAGNIGRNAENATKANELSKKTFSEVELGNQQMQKMIESMKEISQTSSQIGAIIKTIEDIAFQTNILALNASVEAARAGTYGKGFAVVAEEVKNLATKSAEAAKNTNVLIKGSIAAVENGTHIANETAKSLSVISESASRTAELINSISEASESQAAEIEQLNMGIQQISSVVQTNSASSQEAAATSEELNSQAQMMKETINFLKLKQK